MKEEKPLSEKYWTSPLSDRDLFTKEDVAEAVERLKEYMRSKNFGS